MVYSTFCVPHNSTVHIIFIFIGYPCFVPCSQWTIFPNAFLGKWEIAFFQHLKSRVYCKILFIQWRIERCVCVWFWGTLSLCEIDVLVLPKGSKQLWQDQIQEFNCKVLDELSGWNSFYYLLLQLRSLEAYLEVCHPLTFVFGRLCFSKQNCSEKRFQGQNCLWNCQKTWRFGSSLGYRETSRNLGRSWKDMTLKTPNGFNGGFDSNHLLYVASIPTLTIFERRISWSFCCPFLQCRNLVSGQVFYGLPSWRRWRLGWGRMVKTWGNRVGQMKFPQMSYVYTKYR